MIHGPGSHGQNSHALLTGRGNSQVAANLTGQELVNLGMARDGGGFALGGLLKNSDGRRSAEFTSPQLQCYQWKAGGIKPPLHVFQQPVSGIAVLRVPAAFAVKLAAVLFEVENKLPALHATASETFSLSVNSEGIGAPVSSWLASRVI